MAGALISRRLRRIGAAALAVLLAITSGGVAAAGSVRLTDIARIQGVYESSLIGYGLVVGLAGAGDSPRNKATVQSLANTLANFGVRVSETDLNSRNTAAVMIPGTLASYAEQG